MFSYIHTVQNINAGEVEGWGAKDAVQLWHTSQLLQP